ncbi:hypothetical protein M514_01529 [Trichuris suis]|uniref:Uncharacterized protein n=1 Tax=Trichuris suis TaxID=68888 RepID=A0A085NAN6_9BILA|nr:hypothetical protein M514_01529 [Trichuris suis]
MHGVWLLLCLLLAKCTLHEAVRRCTGKSLYTGCYNPVAAATSEERRQVIEVMKKQAFTQLVEGNQLTRVTKVLFVKPDGSFFRSDFLIALTECSAHEKISLEQLYSEECPLRKNVLWRKCNGFFSIKFTFTVPIYCHTFVAEQSQDFSLFNSTQTGRQGTHVQATMTLTEISSDPVKLEQFVKERIFQSTLDIGGRYARLVKIHSHAKSGDALQVNFTAQPSKCPYATKISPDALYSDQCPVLPSEKSLSCSASFPDKPTESATIQCSEDRTVVEPMVSPQSTTENTTTTRDIANLIKREVFESKMQFRGLRARLVKLINKTQTGEDVYVEFAVAPSKCSSELEISLEKLYSPSCPVLDVPEWMLCSGTLPRNATSKYLISCGGTIKATEIKEQDRSLLVSDLVESSLAEKAVETIKTFISNVQIQINGSHARAVKIYRYQPYDNGTYVEFSVTQSACNASEKISIPSLYSRRCPILPADYWILCSGMLPFSPWDKHSITCQERIEPDPNLPEDEPEPTVEERTGHIVTTNSTDPRNASDIATSIKQLIHSSNIRMNGSPAKLVRLNSQEVKLDFIDIKFTVAPTNCSKDGLTLDKLYSEGCPVDSTRPWMLCHSSIPLSENGRLNLACNETVQPERIGTTEPPSVNGTTGQPDGTIIGGKVDLPTVITKIKHMVHESDVQFGGWHVRFVKLIQVDVVNGSVFAQFAIAPCECNAELKLPFDKLYSTLCPVFGVPEWMVCAGTLPEKNDSKYLVNCGERMKAEKIEDADLKESTSSLEKTNASQAAGIEMALQTVRRFIFNVKIELNGSYARVVKLYKVKNYNDEIYVEFAIAESGCKATKEVTLDALYSKYCPVLPSDHWLLCIGLLSHSSDSGYSLTCQGRIESEPLPPDDEPPPTVRDPNGESGDKSNLTSSTAELDEIKTSLKQFLILSNIQMNGTYPRLVRLRKEENKNYVEFVVAPTNCSRQEQVSLEKLYSDDCPIDYTKLWMLCVGTRNAVSHDKFGVACDNVTEPDKQEPTEPPVTTPPTEVQPQSEVPTDEEVVSLIRRSVFESSVQFGGWHARFVKLIKSNMVNDDIAVEFAVAPSGCSSELKVSLEMLYSSDCPVLNVSEWLVCGGTLPRDSESTYLITCGARMKADQSVHSGGATASEKQSTRSDAEQLTEAQKAIEAIQRFVYNVRIEVNGSYARMMKLYRFDTSDTGILVEFSIAQSACPISSKIPITTLYSKSCPVLPSDYWILCNGIVPTSLYGNHSVSCQERIEIDQSLLTNDDMLPTGIDLKRLDQDTPNESKPDDIAYVSSTIKSFLYKSRIELNGSYVRLAKLINHVATPTETYAKFSISPTNCSRDTEIDLDTLYSDQCPPVETDFWIVCRGAVRAYGKEQYSVICNETMKPDKEGISASTPAPEVNVSSPDEGLTRRNLSDPEQVSSLIKKYILESKADIGGWHAKFVKLIGLQKIQEDTFATFALAPCGCRRDLKVTLKQLYSIACPPLNVTEWLVCNGSLPRNPEDPYLFKCNDRMKAEKIDSESRSGFEDITSTSPSANNSEIMQSIETMKLFIFNVRLEINGSYARLTKLYRFEPTSDGVLVEFAICQSACNATDKIEIEQLYSNSCPLVPVDHWVLCNGKVPFRPYEKHSITCNERIEVDPELPDQSRDLIFEGETINLSPMNATMDILQVTEALRRFVYESHIDIEGAYGKLTKLHSYEVKPTGVDIEFTIMKSNCSQTKQIAIEELYSEKCSIVESAYSVHCSGMLPIDGKGHYNIKCEKRMQTEKEDPIVTDPKVTTPEPGPTTPEPLPDLDPKDHTAVIDFVKHLMFSEEININGWYPRFVELLESYNKDGRVYVKYLIAPSECPSNRKVPIEYIYSDSCAVRDVGFRIVCDGLIPLRNGDFINCQIDEKKDTESHVPTETTDQDISMSKKIAEYLKRLLYVERLNIDGWHPRLVKVLESRDAGDKIHVLFSIVASGCPISENVPLQSIYSTSCNQRYYRAPIVCEAKIPLGNDDVIECHTDGNQTVYMPPSVQATSHHDDKEDTTNISISIKNVIFPDRIDLESCKEDFMKINLSNRVAEGIYVLFTVDPSKCAHETQVSPSPKAMLFKLFHPRYKHSLPLPKFGTAAQWRCSYDQVRSRRSKRCLNGIGRSFSPISRHAKALS